MDIRAIQAALNARGQNPPLSADGIPGKKTMAAVDAALSDAADADDWSDARKLIAVEQLIYQDLGIEVGEIDGLVGEQTRFARTAYDARQKNGGKADPEVEKWRDEKQAVKPKTAISDLDDKYGAARSKWPSSSQRISFYGDPGGNQVSLTLPYPMRIAWEPDKVVGKWSCHAKCREPFERIFKRTLDYYGISEIKRLRLDMWGGTLNVRKMRGGSNWSDHAFGAAMDIDPDRNQLRWGSNLASLDDPPYYSFWDFVYQEGGCGLGIQAGYDYMHVAFVRL